MLNIALGADPAADVQDKLLANLPAVRAAARAAGKTWMLVDLDAGPLRLIAQLAVELAETDIGPGEALVPETLQT